MIPDRIHIHNNIHGSPLEYIGAAVLLFALWLIITILQKRRKARRKKEGK